MTIVHILARIIADAVLLIVFMNIWISGYNSSREKFAPGINLAGAIFVFGIVLWAFYSRGLRP